jgi:hypothetical protein
VDEGYARLPGAGYEALHPELEGINPEDYPEIARMRILSDVAPYSREYQKYASIVRRQSEDNPDLKVEYERISEQVRQTKESTLQVTQRHFNAPVDTIEGTVKSASARGVELKEYPGQVFQFSSVGSSMADLTAETLGRSNKVIDTRSLPRHRTKYSPARAGAEASPGGIPESAPQQGPALPSGLARASYIDASGSGSDEAASVFPSGLQDEMKSELTGANGDLFSSAVF